MSRRGRVRPGASMRPRAARRGAPCGQRSRLCVPASAGTNHQSRIANPGRRGFTLLEVLVALFLLSIALVALIRAAGLEARALSHERDATLAQWVASNALAEVRLRERLPTGREEGREELGGRRWRWRLELTATDSPKIVRADVSVFPDEESDVAADAASARLQGFIER